MEIPRSGRVARQLADGVGGLRFQAVSPPGLARLIRIPFYFDRGSFAGFHALSEAVLVSALTATGSTTSTEHPIIAFRAPAASPVGANVCTPFLSTEPVLFTPRVPWARFRIVGFEVMVWRQVTLVRDAYMELCVRDLQLGGGSTLFSHEDYAPAGIYAMGQAGFAGLRDYPIVKSTNRASVSVQYAGTCTTLDGGIGPDVPMDLFSMFSCCIVGDVLYDDQTGAHIPGPYGRQGAVVRRGGRERP